MLWKTLAITLIILGFAGQFWSQAIWDRYWNQLPRSPDPVAGRIYPLNMHGVAAYQTLGERSHLERVENCFWAVLLVGVAIGAIQQWKSKKSKEKYS